MKFDYQETTLKNGLRIATSRIPHVGSITAGIWVAVGGRYEKLAVSGISHFIEHLLFKGTPKRSARQISEAVEGRGGYFNAFTQEESTCYYARLGGKHIGQVVDVLSDMYLNAKFDPDDIEKERGVICEEIMMYRDQPHHVVHELLEQALWVNHSLGRPLIGPESNIRNFTRDDFMAFKNDYYVPNNSLVVIAGNLEHQACVDHVEKALSGMKKGRFQKAAKLTDKTKQQPFTVEHRKIEQTHLAMGFRIFGRHDERRYALKLLSVVLGGNMSSRLFQVVREKYGMAYSIHSSTNLFDETGSLMISAGLDRRRGAKAVDLIAREICRIKEKPVGPRVLKRAKEYTVGHMMNGLESTSSQMMWIGDQLIGFGNFRQPAEIMAGIEAVTSEDIQRVAHDIFDSKRLSVAVVAPEDCGINEQVMNSCEL